MELNGTSCGDDLPDSQHMTKQSQTRHESEYKAYKLCADRHMTISFSGFSQNIHLIQMRPDHQTSKISTWEIISAHEHKLDIRGCF